MSSNRLIKKYKYIDKETQTFKRPERIIKTGECSAPDLDQYDPNSKLEPDLSRKKNPATRDSRKLIKAGDYPAINLDQFDPETKKRLEARIAAQSSLESKTEIHKAKTATTVQDAGSVAGNSADKQPEPSLQDIPTDTKVVSQAEVDQAYNKGLQEGRANGLAEGDAKAAEVTQVINNVLAEFDRSSAEFFEEIEKVTIDMSLHLAEKIIGEAASSVPDVIKTNVDKCINLLAGAGTVEIKLNPADYETIKAHLPSLDRKFENRYSFVLEPDQGIERGGCLVEFEGSMIDGRIETQFEKIKQHMEILN